jgi:hypothetical protein
MKTKTNFSFLEGGAIVLLSVIVFVGLIVGLCTATGCSIPLAGGGEIGIGYRSQSTVLLYSTVDGDKQDATSRASLEVNQSILEAVLGVGNEDEPSEGSNSPLTGNPE